LMVTTLQKLHQLPFFAQLDEDALRDIAPYIQERTFALGQVVLHSARALEKQGFRVTYLNVDGYGRVDLDQLREAITPETILVSVQAANQEIGTLQDVEAIGQICREGGTLFHTDATHSFPRVELDVREVSVDLVTVTAHLIHGPKGIGGLYARKGTPLAKWMDGGFQEFNLRAGEENIPGAVGFAKAVELVTPEETARLREMRDRLIERLLFRPGRGRAVSSYPDLRGASQPGQGTCANDGRGGAQTPETHDESVDRAGPGAHQTGQRHRSR